MPRHVRSSHRITIGLPADACQRLFTPAGEELWVEGWQPVYHHPADGRTAAGMVFSTGSGDEATWWTLVDYRTEAPRLARYVRVTPASRSGIVEVRCTPLSPMSTEVEVGYEMTAVTPQGEAALAAYEGEAFVGMIEQWRSLIEAHLPALATASIR